MPIPRDVKRFWKNIVGLAVSNFLFWEAGLWQREIVDICIYECRAFDWPFYALPSLNCWVARDMVYAFIVAAYVLQFFSLWFWEE